MVQTLFTPLLGSKLPRSTQCLLFRATCVNMWRKAFSITEMTGLSREKWGTLGLKLQLLAYIFKLYSPIST